MGSRGVWIYLRDYWAVQQSSKLSIPQRSNTKTCGLLCVGCVGPLPLREPSRLSSSPTACSVLSFSARREDDRPTTHDRYHLRAPAAVAWAAQDWPPETQALTAIGTASGSRFLPFLPFLCPGCASNSKRVNQSKTLRAIQSLYALPPLSPLISKPCRIESNTNLLSPTWISSNPLFPL